MAENWSARLDRMLDCVEITDATDMVELDTSIVLFGTLLSVELIMGVVVED